MSEENSIITKRQIWRLINSKLKRTINAFHVLTVITVLLDEMLKDLKEGKEIKINNFGKLKIATGKPRKYFNVHKKQFLMSKEHKSLQIVMVNRIKSIIKPFLNIRSVFKNDKESGYTQDKIEVK